MVRYKNRYLVVELLWKDGKFDYSLGETPISQALKDSVSLNFGDYGQGLMSQSLQVRYFNPFTNVAIVRCTEACKNQAAVAVTLLDEVKSRRCSTVLRYTSGRIQKAKEMALCLSRKRYLSGVIKKPNTERYLEEFEDYHQRLLALNP
uniref:Ribonuclease P/MRP protein subunit POP5 n=1 Tax=Polytomella parva TaxID=51329 RepID=A0A7S0YRF2_9CHLO|mmetsp:Transcript_9216/g.17296  ORF Transcript_9216/g.17296 Transcript_9216/m.17296 type:complete len:148 (+) Transcript_9216:145-588(+)